MRTDWQRKGTFHSKCAIQGACNESRAGSIRFSCLNPCLPASEGRYYMCGRDSTVGTATRYELVSPGIKTRQGRDCPPPLRGPPGLLYNLYRGLPEVKLPERGAIYFLSGDWYSGWSHTCISPRRLHKHITRWHLPLLNYVGYSYCLCSVKLVDTWEMKYNRGMARVRPEIRSTSLMRVSTSHTSHMTCKS